MSKIIIRNNAEVADNVALEYVTAVMKAGRVSKSSMGEQYSYVTTFKTGLVVYATKPSNQTDTFRLEKDKF